MPTDFTARITEILARHEATLGGDACDCGWYWDRKEGRNHFEHVATLITQAAEEHYRPRVETVEQLDALPVGSVVADSYPDAMTKLNDGWYCCSGGGRRQRYELPARLLWSPGAGE